MPDTPHDPYRRTHTASMADEFMEFDLSADIHRLRAEATWSTGQNARTARAEFVGSSGRPGETSGSP